MMGSKGRGSRISGVETGHCGRERERAIEREGGREGGSGSVNSDP